MPLSGSDGISSWNFGTHQLVILHRMVFMMWFSLTDEFMRQNVHLVGKYIVMVSCNIINQSNLKLASVHLR
jgi:hypothetical protein